MSRHGTESELVDYITEASGSLWAGDTILADSKADESGLHPICTSMYDQIFGQAVSQGNRKGRGPSLFDIFRAWSPDGKAENTRACCMAIKTEKEKASYIRLTTGGDSHMQRVLTAALNGYDIVVLIFQETEEQFGRVAVINVSPIIQKFGAPAEPLPFGEKYGRGQAPEIYYSWSSVRNTGVKGNGKARDRVNMEYPYYDAETGIYHESATARRYRELKVNIHAIKAEWIENVHYSDVPSIIENVNWSSVAF